MNRSPNGSLGLSETVAIHSSKTLTAGRVRDCVPSRDARPLRRRPVRPSVQTADTCDRKLEPEHAAATALSAPIPFSAPPPADQQPAEKPSARPRQRHGPVDSPSRHSSRSSLHHHAFPRKNKENTTRSPWRKNRAEQHWDVPGLRRSALSPTRDCSRLHKDAMPVPIFTRHDLT